MVVVERKMMEEENTKRYRLLAYLGMGMMRMIVVLVLVSPEDKESQAGCEDPDAGHDDGTEVRVDG